MDQLKTLCQQGENLIYHPLESSRPANHGRATQENRTFHRRPGGGRSFLWIVENESHHGCT